MREGFDGEINLFMLDGCYVGCLSLARSMRSLNSRFDFSFVKYIVQMYARSGEL